MCACAYAYAYKTYEYVWPAWYMLLYWTCVTFVSEGQCGSTFLPLETNKHSSLWAASSATHFSSTPKAKVSEKIHGKFRRLSSSPPTRIFRNGWTCVTQISEWWWWKFRKLNHPTNKETRYDQPQFNQANHFLKGKISPLENDKQPAPSTQPILRFLRKNLGFCWTTTHDSGWACALDRPSDFSRATVELAMDFPMHLGETVARKGVKTERLGGWWRW